MLEEIEAPLITKVAENVGWASLYITLCTFAHLKPIKILCQKITLTTNSKIEIYFTADSTAYN